MCRKNCEGMPQRSPVNIHWESSAGMPQDAKDAACVGEKAAVVSVTPVKRWTARQYVKPSMTRLVMHCKSPLMSAISAQIGESAKQIEYTIVPNTQTQWQGADIQKPEANRRYKVKN